MSMQVTCELRDGPFALQNPVMPAPGGFGNVAEFAQCLDLSRLGALVPNSLMRTGGAPSANDKFVTTPCGYLSAYGPNNISLQGFIDEVLGTLPAGVPVMVDLKARSIEEMGELAAAAAADPRIAAVEINLNCPYAAPGPAYWADPLQLERLIGTARRSVKGKPLVVKGPGGLYPLEAVVPVLEAAGADIFVPFNAITGTVVDVRTRACQSGGYFGPGIKPVGVARCQQAAAMTQMPIIGAGGITCAEDVLEYIMAGAFAVQVGSANLTRPDLMANLLDDLQVLMDELGITALDAVRGTAAPMTTELF